MLKSHCHILYTSHILFFFNSITMLRLSKRKVAKEEFYGEKRSLKIWGIDVNNIVILKLVETRKIHIWLDI